MSIAPSGEQWEIRYGKGADEQHAIVVEVGGGLREYRQGGRDVLDPFPLDAMCDGAHNMPLVPWPNRIQDGRYRFDGEDYQVALTEPEQHNAIHGFGRWSNWRVREHEANRIVVGLMIYPRTGYPFTLDVSVEYTLDDKGLTTRTTARNLGNKPCPYACGQHPYLRCDTETIDELELELRADEWLPTGAQQIPTGVEAVAGSPFDFRSARRLGEQKIDYAYTGLARDADGRAWARVRSPVGRRVGLWVDEQFQYLEIYTGDTLAPHRRRRGLGVEPMTCAPNGFASGEGLIRLEPGESITATWGVVVG
ncbi:MAG TPA: aldose 1-epimerase family protein [Gammaproteobacteria bacterium]|nr:aldose 1-epimerase family protein [Gammaproteobacteria bacterium]